MFSFINVGGQMKAADEPARVITNYAVCNIYLYFCIGFIRKIFYISILFKHRTQQLKYYIIVEFCGENLFTYLFMFASLHALTRCV
jgi:hypothetical protein